MTPWKVGDSALCIMDKPWIDMNGGVPYNKPAPALGEIYLVTSMTVWQDHVLLTFAEFGRAGFASHLFRPVQKQGLDDFRKILKKEPHYV